MSDAWRIVPCEACQTEGRIIRDAGYNRWGEPQEIDEGPCPYCEGTGGELIEAEPIEEEDLLAVPDYLRLLSDAERQYDGPIPESVRRDIEARGRAFDALSPRQQLEQSLAEAQQEIYGLRLICAELGCDIKQMAFSIPNLPDEERRSIWLGTIETKRLTWKLHASLMVSAYRRARALRRQLDEMRPRLVAAE